MAKKTDRKKLKSLQSDLVAKSVNSDEEQAAVPGLSKTSKKGATLFTPSKSARGKKPSKPTRSAKTGRADKAASSTRNTEAPAIAKTIKARSTTSRKKTRKAIRKASSAKGKSVTKSSADNASEPRPASTKKSAAPGLKMIIECAWEVCNQVGGIYTVIRSKVPAVIQQLQVENYVLFGPYVTDHILAELDFTVKHNDAISKTIKKLNKGGWNIIEANWLVTGRPRVVLFDVTRIRKSLEELKFELHRDHGISSPHENEYINNAVRFGHLVFEFLSELQKSKKPPQLIVHFHEWQSSLPILHNQKTRLKGVKTVFTTHATILGRYLAINSNAFYDHLPFFDVEKEAQHFGIVFEVRVERLSASYADSFTTVSQVTGRECKHLLKKQPDHIVPNGLNITRFEALHEFQNLHAEFKEEIHEFVMGHFFQSYPFDLDKTLYFFTSGRFEYVNKGFDLTLTALNALNQRLKKEKSDKTVVMFFITRRPNYGIASDILESKGVMDEIRSNVEVIKEQVGKALFVASTTNEDHRLPNLNEFVDDYWRLRYRRTIQTWKTKRKPYVLTHYLPDPKADEIMRFLDQSTLDNSKDQRVKIVYHPEFINTSNPLFGIEYHEFVRGCHLGVFPSFYEPWGYTPLECMASGVPSVTSDLSGFGDYVLRNIEEYEKKGIYVVERGKKTFQWSAQQLTDILYNFTQQNRRDRITQRNSTENASQMFDWQHLYSYYREAYDFATLSGRKKASKVT